MLLFTLTYQSECVKANKCSDYISTGVNSSSRAVSEVSDIDILFIVCIGSYNLLKHIKIGVLRLISAVIIYPQGS